ncbi:AAEL009972-PA [Aedes aegypti]|uniref:AAEL009972-PA n=1 Tax=Aedes aegypti TaxID=7159 RepID=Q16UB5_AEDAE|nr:AAEL009972-PA [Aedes aegypti]
MFQLLLILKSSFTLSPRSGRMSSCRPSPRRISTSSCLQWWFSHHRLQCIQTVRWMLFKTNNCSSRIGNDPSFLMLRYLICTVGLFVRRRFFRHSSLLRWLFLNGNLHSVPIEKIQQLTICFIPGTNNVLIRRLPMNYEHFDIPGTIRFGVHNVSGPLIIFGKRLKVSDNGWMLMDAVEGQWLCWCWIS